MKIVIPLLLIFISQCIFCIEIKAQQKLSINPLLDNESHDMRLSPWGPYSKRYAGISHINDMASGMRFDFSVCPGYYRNKVLVPNVLFESGYTPWKISPDMKTVTYRYQLEWKDQVYTDVTYYTLDSSRVLVEMKCVNNTNYYQNLTLNTVSFIDYPSAYPLFKAENTDSMKWVNAVDYIELDLVNKSPRYFLAEDGKNRNESRNDSALDGSLLAGKFGNTINDQVSYTVGVDSANGEGTLFFRYRVNKGDTARFQLSGISDAIIAFPGTGNFEFKQIACLFNPENKLTLRSVANTEIVLDGFFVTRVANAKVPQIVPQSKNHHPLLVSEKESKKVLLKYKDINTYYGLAWDYAGSAVREVLNDELDIFFKLVSNNNVKTRFEGNEKGHFTNLFFRPIEVKPHGERKIYVLLCKGSENEVKSALDKFDAKALLAAIPKQPAEEPILPAGNKYIFGNQLLQAAILSNVVYPIYTQRQFIRHFTPGKWWNSLYTWDVGFIALGMQEVDLQKSYEAINAYTTNVGNQSAFIHHGSPVPVQFYAFYDLMNRTQNKALLTYMYPRLKQYYQFMVGEIVTSTTRMPSNLLKTWDYFYNSGGWDDYAPQHYLRDHQDIRSSVTPVITTAQMIRASKIMRLCAAELGFLADIPDYDNQITKMSAALQKYSWDEATGYFSYVMHDANGAAQKIFRFPSDKSNFNMGLDGVSPLISGIATKTQQERMIENIFSPKHLWTPYGITAVDQSASYFRQDGYWNGTVWMPHQWFMWKALLDIGEGDKAFQIAKTALDLWKRETELTYSTFEHFISSSGRGAGWSQFSGLSSPVLNWFAAYYKMGRVTNGFEVWIEDQQFNKDFSYYTANIRFDESTPAHQRCMLVCMNPEFKYDVFLNDKKLKTISYHPGFVQIYLPASNIKGVLKIKTAYKKKSLNK